MTAAPPTDAAALRALLELDDLPAIARGLLGCRIAVAGGPLCTVVETEAYHESEPACHGYLGRTGRAAKLRRPPGHAYVYLSYGIHRLVNVVCGPEEVASAVLIRGLEVRGADGSIAGVPGPGRVGALLGAELSHDGIDLLSGRELWSLLPADGESPEVRAVCSGPRIGITKAVELPWRFWLQGSSGVSAPR